MYINYRCQYKDEHLHGRPHNSGFGWFCMPIITHIHIIIKAETRKNVCSITHQINSKSDITMIKTGKRLFLETTASNCSPTLVFKSFNN